MTSDIFSASIAKNKPPKGAENMGKNFTVVNSGTMSDWQNNVIERPDGRKVSGKKFLKDELQTTGCEMSINSLPPGASVPFYHAHKENEELYIFLSGKGQMEVDGEVFDVGEGTIVRVAPAGERIWRNNGDVPVTCVVLQVREGSLRQHSAGDGIITDKKVAWKD